MILKLDPRHPMVWRTPWSLQFGTDPAVLRLDDVSETQERLLAALAVGVSRPGLTMIARGKGDELYALLQAVGPLLEVPATEGIATATVAGSGHLADHIGTGLRASGVQVAAVAEESPDLAILVHDYVTPPALHGLWLRRDVPHLPVVTSESGVLVGPIVEPGVGPCLLCLELHRRDADPAWPAMATQLLGRSVDNPPALRLDASAVTLRMALGRIANGPGPAVSVRIDARTGRRDYAEWQQHPECGCRGIEHLLQPLPQPANADRPGTDWAGAALDPVPR